MHQGQMMWMIAMSDRSNLPAIAELLQPFEGDCASGRDLRLDITPQSLYFRLRDARSEARAGERLADNDPAAPEGNASRYWKLVQDLAIEALTTSTKDIEIAVWLTESLVRSDGLAGLVTGAELLSGLVTGFWNSDLFPLPDDEGIESRVAPIAGLNGQGSDGTLLQPLRKLTMFERVDGAPLTLWQFEQSEDVAALSDAARKTQRLAAGVIPFADIEADANATGRAALAILGKDVVRAIAAWRALEDVLAAVAGDAVPPTRRIYDLLDKLRRIVERYVPAAELSPPEAVPAEMVEAAGDVPAVKPHGAVDREALLGQISHIAALFRQSEPNSPLSYTLEDAVRRARLGWPDLLKEMMPDIAPRAAILSGLGIRPPPD
jgi:type VI secretion system protein ImpA